MTVLQLIAHRRAQLIQFGSFQDNHRLGLSVEGGGMRGIVTAAMLIALQERGLLDVFDGFYGASSGTSNLAYVLAGQGWQGMSIYYDRLASKAFISPMRALYGRKILDMDYVAEVITNLVPLDVETLLNSKKSFVITMANVSKNRGELRRSFENKADLLDCILASLQIPLLGGQPVMIHNDRYLDGGLYYIDPLEAAIEDSCSHVLALHSRPENGYPAEPGPGQQIVSRLIDEISPGVGDEYTKRLTSYYAMSKELGFGAVLLKNTALYRLAVPEDGHEVKRMTSDGHKLVSAGRAGYQAVLDIFDPDKTSYISYAS